MADWNGNGLMKWVLGVVLAGFVFFAGMWFRGVNAHVSEIPVSRIESLESHYTDINTKLDLLIKDMYHDRIQSGR